MSFLVAVLLFHNFTSANVEGHFELFLQIVA